MMTPATDQTKLFSQRMKWRRDSLFSSEHIPSL